MGKNKGGEVVAFAIQIGPVTKGRYKNKDKAEICSNCNKSGHNSNSCFQLIGYLDWWGDKPHGNG